jgi:hypothetical protein
VLSYTACFETAARYTQATVVAWASADGDAVCQAAFGPGYCWAEDGNAAGGDAAGTAIRQLIWNAANSNAADAQICSAYQSGNFYNAWMRMAHTNLAMELVGPVGGFDNGWVTGTSGPNVGLNSCFDSAATYNRFGAANLICCR